MFGWHRQISRGERRSVWAAWQWRRPALRTAARSHSRHSPDRLRGIENFELNIEALRVANVAGSAVSAVDARTWQTSSPADAPAQD